MARQPRIEIPIDPEVIAELQAVTAERLKLQVTYDAKNEAFELVQRAEAAAHAADIAADKAQMDALDARTWEIIEANRASLIPPGRESFVTGVATYRFDNFKAKREVVNAKELMEMARKMGLVRRFAKAVRRYEFVPAKFLDAYDKMSAKLKLVFKPYINEVPAWRKLSVTPNATYVVVLDNTRLTPPPITSRRDIDKDGKVIELDTPPMS